MWSIAIAAASVISMVARTSPGRLELEAIAAPDVGPSWSKALYIYTTKSLSASAEISQV
jgi:hypothetical protein